MTCPYSIACVLFARSVANSAMSLPGENAFSPAPRTMMHRRSSSLDRPSIAAPNSCHIGLVSAFSFSGRFSTTVAMGPSRVTRMSSLMSAHVLPIKELHETKPEHGHIGHENQDCEQHA